MLAHQVSVSSLAEREHRLVDALRGVRQCEELLAEERSLLNVTHLAFDTRSRSSSNQLSTTLNRVNWRLLLMAINRWPSALTS